uniref:Serine/threonine-protein phosphatase 1 regulatory subunit 10-like n=1 Tax=Diabrotica virgifera virgifera TaxID=50390 RepID=A0A6P7EXL0_DIAVI
MPRIDPVQLLKCLSVLLTPEGGMKAEEVTRLVGLMTKFSKKLVSKCIYILILKNTKTELLDTFMAEGGWTLIQTWLQDAVHTSNRHLVKEIIGLLLITPVDVERLKTNILPKLIKSLSRRDDLEDVAELSSELVKHWLVIVKGSSNNAQGQPQAEKMDLSEADNTNNSVKDNSTDRISPNTFYKKDGQTSPTKEGADDSSKEDVEMKDVSKEKSKNKDEKLDKEDKAKSSSRSSRSTSSSKDKEKSRDKDKYRDKERSKSSSSSSKSSSSKSKSSSSSSRDKDRRDRDREREKEKSRREKSRDKDKSKDKERDKQRNNGVIKSNSSNKDSSREKKEEKKDKDKSESDIFNLVKTPSIDKLGRIPKKSNSASVDSKPKDDRDANEVKKKSFSVGIKKDATPEERPKTVKVFNSKMRSTGLEEEVKPAPSRVAVKKPTTLATLPPIPLKRSSPPRDIREPSIPPEKKIKMDKVDIPDRPGAIKLIPPKPKPILQESDLFSDALTAATSKKEPKKRRRRLSSSKETPTSPTTSPQEDPLLTPTTAAPPSAPAPVTTEVPAESPLGLKNIAPINFYQDTLSEEVEETPEENKENSTEEEITNLNEEEVVSESENKENEIRSPRAVTPTEDDPEELKRINAEGLPKGVLLHSKRKGPKKTISWKNDTDLVEIRYFELDETERVNVTKAFNDMAKMEYSNEREALQLSRKVGGEDLMSVQIVWRIPFEIDLPDPLAPPGSKSLEKDIQFAREKSVLQALYFDRRKIPDSPEEPVPENHQIVDPIIIALEDPDGQEIDLKTTPWPEPKGLPPTPEPQIPIVYPNMQPQFNPQFNNMNPSNFMAPRFSAPNGPMVPQIPNNFIPNNMMPTNNMLGIGAHNLLQPNDMMMGPMNPNMFQPGPMADGFGPGPEPDYPPMYGNPNGPASKNMNSFPPKNFRDIRGDIRGDIRDSRNNNRGSGGFRRGRGGNNDGGWVSMSDSRGRGSNWRRGGRGGRLCKHIQNHGYCRNGDKCAFIHP